MNPIEKVARRIDRAQQGFAPAAFGFGVVKKFGDDRAGSLAALIAYYGFLSLFPLLLLLVTILGIVAGHDPAFAKSVEHSALSQFPVIGTQLGKNITALHDNSVPGLVVGILGLIWGSQGAIQAGQYAMAEVWNVPGVVRPNFWSRLIRTLLMMAVIGIFLVTPRESDRSGMTAINRGFFTSAIISLVLVIGAAFWYLPSSFSKLTGVTDATVLAHHGNPRWLAIGAVIIGIVLASAIQLLTGYFTEVNRKPVMDIGESSETGAATVILSGISTGMESAVYAALLIGGAVFGAFLLAYDNPQIAFFAVALTGTGLLTTVGVIVTMDSFGPVTDNAQGIAEMSGDVEGEGARVLTQLDAIGNTTKAITKGIAIATAVLAATALFGAFDTTVKDKLGAAASTFNVSVDRPNVLVGVIIGAAVVFMFAGLLIMAVGRAAQRVVLEVRNQFRNHPGIMDYTEKPDYAAVVDICTKDSLRELATPGILAILTPIAVGFSLGYAPLGSFLAGAIAAGVLMAVFLANSGGAWDNAKKMVEDGLYGGKGSDSHAATVIGDTVGDPFKDTAGPAINPLIKVMNLVSVLIAPAVIKYSIGYHKSNAVRMVIAAIAFLIIAAAVIVSKRRTVSMGDMPADQEPAAPTAPAAA